jgi:hypothetical protein
METPIFVENFRKAFDIVMNYKIFSRSILAEIVCEHPECLIAIHEKTPFTPASVYDKCLNFTIPPELVAFQKKIDTEYPVVSSSNEGKDAVEEESNDEFGVSYTSTDINSSSRWTNAEWEETKAQSLAGIHNSTIAVNMNKMFHTNDGIVRTTKAISNKLYYNGMGRAFKKMSDDEIIKNVEKQMVNSEPETRRYTSSGKTYGVTEDAYIFHLSHQGYSYDEISEKDNVLYNNGRTADAIKNRLYILKRSKNALV